MRPYRAVRGRGGGGNRAGPSRTAGRQHSTTTSDAGTLITRLDRGNEVCDHARVIPPGTCRPRNQFVQLQLQLDELKLCGVSAVWWR
jgi:hypothetical protein